MQSKLPAAGLIPELITAVAAGNVIVGAPPGAGKSTVLPLALLEHVPGRIVMLQPRRVVVRNLAAYLASLLGEETGQTVGYRIRGESKVSKQTRLEIVTEGVLSARIQRDPELAGVDLIIFDEFHERSIHSDFGLALALEVQEGLREDLSLVVMSATLDVDELLTLIPDATVLKSAGRQFEVEEVYTGQVQSHTLHEQVTRQIQFSLAQDDGDILVFLPGAGAINKVATLLEQRLNASEYVVHPLYGALSKQRQTAAILPDSRGMRKIILATNIAETSLTIEGIKVVIDAGLENVANYHPPTGFTRLNTQMISQASAIQRKGRAGRLGPGKVYRMWPKEQHDRLAKYPLPQILREDISPLTLDALAWGTELHNMRMLTPPSQAQSAAALHRLQQAGAVDRDGTLTAHGRGLNKLSVHPALANMLVKAKEAGAQTHLAELEDVACYVAAACEEHTASERQFHVSAWLEQLAEPQLSGLKARASRFASALGISLKAEIRKLNGEAVAVCLALAFPERVARRKQGSDYKLASGRGAALPEGMIEKSDWLVVKEGQVNGSDVIIRQAEPVNESLLRQLYPGAFKVKDTVTYNSQKKQMEARKTEGFHEIVLSSEPAANVPARIRGEAWVSLLEGLPLSAWPFSEKDWQWWYRYQMACGCDLHQPQAFDSPPVWKNPESPLSLLDRSDISARLSSFKSWEQLAGLSWATLLHQSLPWSQQHAMDNALPLSITVPSGEKRKLVYRSNGEVVLPVRLQEMFGCADTFTVADGAKVITLELLSPAGRPVQTTSDLAGFWQGSYLAVQKEMKGRYPKHRWPDNPMEAEAGRSMKPRK